MANGLVMVKQAGPVSSASRLPDSLKSLFLDCDFPSLRLGEHGSFVIRRVIDRGDCQAITWLRHTLGDDAIRQWFLAKRGGELDARKLRFWEVVFDMPKSDVDEWVRRVRSLPGNSLRLV